MVRNSCSHYMETNRCKLFSSSLLSVHRPKAHIWSELPRVRQEDETLRFLTQFHVGRHWMVASATALCCGSSSTKENPPRCLMVLNERLRQEEPQSVSNFYNLHQKMFLFFIHAPSGWKEAKNNTYMYMKTYQGHIVHSRHSSGATLCICWKCFCKSITFNFFC